MKISKILIEDRIKEKILYKHNIRASEVKNALLNNPLILRTGKGRYLAIGKDRRVITTIFELEKDTAYPSSDAQRKLYKRKRG